MTTPDPCPFCGHVGLSFDEGSTFRWLAYSCSGCGMGNETRVQTLGEGTPEQWLAQAELEAIKEWNTRTPTPDLLPPLPEPFTKAGLDIAPTYAPLFTADQMRAYARAAIAAQPQAGVKP